METLSSLKNPRVQLWRSLKERKARKETGLFLVEGRKMVTEALASDFSVETILCDAAQAETYASLLSQGEAALLPAHVLAAVCDTKTPQGIAAVVRMGAIAHLGKRLVALDGVQDPGNVGTILRTADCAGMESSCRRSGARTHVYYCHPYSAYERGSNEAANRIIRRFLPKGTDFSSLTRQKVKEIEAWMNDYPREKLGWKSANRAIAEHARALSIDIQKL